MNLQESIRRIIREESSRISKIHSMIENIGILNAVKAVGGYDNMVKILGDDFFDKKTKIELITDIADQYGIRNQIYAGDFDIDIIVNELRYDDGSYTQTYVIYVDEDGYFYYKTYEFDENNDMFDEPVDEGYRELDTLSDSNIDKITKALIKVI